MILPPLVFSAVQFQFSRYTQTQHKKLNCVALQVWSSFIFCHNEANCIDLVITAIESCGCITMHFNLTTKPKNNIRNWTACHWKFGVVLFFLSQWDKLHRFSYYCHRSLWQYQSASSIFFCYTQAQHKKQNCVALEVWSSFISCHIETNCVDLVITHRSLWQYHCAISIFLLHPNTI